MEITKDALEAYAKEFAENLPQQLGVRAHAIGLKGDLGAGKTTFVQHVAKTLGVKEQVTSPTFVIAQTYSVKHPVFDRLIHIDAYRLRGEQGDTIGFHDYLDNPKNLVLVEWPENLPEGADFPEGAPTLTFETIDEATRRITQNN